MDIGKEQRVIQIEPEPLVVPSVPDQTPEPDRANEPPPELTPEPVHTPASR